MNKNASIVLTLALIVGIGIIFMNSSKSSTSTEQAGSAQNVGIKDGVQYITIEAKGGYSPRVTTAQAGIPTKLIMETNGTYDCSAALVIRSINYQNILPQVGKTEIDLGIPKTGPLTGVCGMGMYNFSINFE